MLLKVLIYKAFFLLSLIIYSGTLYSQINEINMNDTRVDSLYMTTADLDKNPHFYIKGKPDGCWIVYFDTFKKTKAFEVIYKNKEELSYKTWFKNDKIKAMYDIKNNIEIEWYSNGSLKYFFNLINDTCLFNFYYDNGVIKQQNIFLKISKNDMVELKEYKWSKEGLLLKDSLR